MKITNVEPLVVGAGWRSWIFVKIQTDDGLTGWGECSDARGPEGIAGTIRDLAPVILGQDPQAYEARFADMARSLRSSTGGIAAKAMAGIEGALLDIAGQALGVSVTRLLGGPTRDRIRLYWSHCGSPRVRRLHEVVGADPIETWDDVTALGKEVVARGYTALKTNILMPGQGATWYSGFDGSMSADDEWVSNKTLAHIETLVGTLRDAVGPDVDLNLDLNFHFKPEACIRIAQALEPYRLQWLEIDNPDPDALVRIGDATRTRICTGETLIHTRGYLPYLQKHAADVFMIDVPWNGVAQAKKVADLAGVFQHNVAPHNQASHLATFMSAALCGVLTNVRIMETDVDDVLWKDQLTTAVPDIVDGYMAIPDAPGWGIAINEDVAREHPWTDLNRSMAKNLPPSKSF
ncbi:MAG TPA: mandelate racemase/muconate lactonizing enzyme family protein [Pseudolysinimonas sp.]|nr:mandelate racemase/muconate lactonizing enzyme family protein [Pseudolysinimonas sp.]